MLVLFSHFVILMVFCCRVAVTSLVIFLLVFLLLFLFSLWPCKTLQIIGIPGRRQTGLEQAFQNIRLAELLKQHICFQTLFQNNMYASKRSVHGLSWKQSLAKVLHKLGSKQLSKTMGCNSRRK